MIVEPPAVLPRKASELIPEDEINAVVGRLLSSQPEEQSAMSPVGDFDADVVVIGSGPGGYVAAIRAAQLGARTVCIEKQATEWGGTCLNWGCIPTKAMIASVERLMHVRHADAMGVVIKGEVCFDFSKMMERKNKVVTTLRGGVQQLLKSNHVRSIVGTGRLVDAHTVEVVNGSETQRITTDKIIIATGSVPVIPPIPGLQRNPDDPRGVSTNGIWTSDEAVSATECPGRMLILGSGAVGLEFSYTYRNLGAEVTVVEIMPEILPVADREISAELRKSLKKQGIQILTDARLVNVERTASGLVSTIETKEGARQVETDVILVGAGRRAAYEGLGVETVGIRTHPRGIEVNDYLQTSVPNIYAIGDVTGRLLLAHLASHMGIVAAENAMGHSVKMDYRAVPSPIYTVPEVAWVGLTEEEARQQGYDVITGKFPFRPLGRAMALNEQEGLVKVVAERKYGELLGVHIIGPYATELIHEGVIAIKLESTVEELMTSIHAHPTLAEAIGEAALDVRGEAIHKPRR
ncbi:MAG: dihydrolipoyl dehydrogenase [Chloroherpetonaceae bacterium]|nr:dihydrolipoyl dehydrogenase [Chthonomonadaceae bacterium]MDW8208512.1 dihydrolipoyl dehydrogenase [Chloroherpetonaceae bacterium]